MNSTPKFNFHDILWAPVQALAAKKILAMTFFLVMALAVHDLFAYLAPAVEGENMRQIWSAYGFFPFYNIAYASALGKTIWGFGVFGSILMVMLGLFAVSAIDIERARGNPFLSAKDAIKFAFSRLPQIFLAELAIAVFVGFIILLFALLGLIGRVPWIGEWIVAAFFLLPGFIIAMLTIFIFAVIQISFLLMPAVAAAERHGETFGVILETFSTIVRQPFRWLGYTFYSLGAAKLASFVYAYFAFRAVQFSVWSAGLGGGESIEQLVRSGLSYLPVRSDLVRGMFNAFPGFDYSFSINKYLVGGVSEGASGLMAVMLFLIFLSILGYFFAILASAQAASFIAIRKIKDNYDISGEDSLFFEDEHVNPPIDGE